MLPFYLIIFSKAVVYSNNLNIGTATVTITGKGDYYGSTKHTFNIVPPGIKKITKATAGAKKITVKWKKPNKTLLKLITGVEIQCSHKKDFSSGNKSVKIKKTKTQGVVKKLKSKKTYYVRIRTYKKIGKTIYGSVWSKTKKVKVK